MTKLSLTVAMKFERGSKQYYNGSEFNLKKHLRRNYSIFVNMHKPFIFIVIQFFFFVNQ